jgi:hypothetical protein
LRINVTLVVGLDVLGEGQEFSTKRRGLNSRWRIVGAGGESVSFAAAHEV